MIFCKADTPLLAQALLALAVRFEKCLSLLGRESRCVFLWVERAHCDLSARLGVPSHSLEVGPRCIRGKRGCVHIVIA